MRLRLPGRQFQITFVTMDKVQQEIDQLYKKQFGKLVASLLYSSRDIDPETAEDIAQDSFSAALANWRLNGIPLNPNGWLYKVCRNKALTLLTRNKKVRRLEENDNLTEVEVRFSDSILDDQPLKMLFACAHPDLSPKVQVVVTLKYVNNFKVEAISKILGMTVDGVDKLLLRARQRIKDEKILLEEPDTAALTSRIPIVHKILYLLFSEGYKTSWGNQVIREDLCEEALIMTKILHDSALRSKETSALYSLMLFNSARFKSRFDPAGELLDLENQDRSLWDKDLISLGCHFLNLSQDNVISSYHLEASIACLHCTARSFNDTNWTAISNLYARLLHENPNPFVELNQAIALYYSGKKTEALQQLNELHRKPFLNQYFLLNTTLGKFYHLEGNSVLAETFLKKASLQTNSPQEKKFIQKMINALDPAGRTSSNNLPFTQRS